MPPQFFFFFFFFCPHIMACRILVPQPGIEPMPPGVEVQSLNHWTAREVLAIQILYYYGPCWDSGHFRTATVAESIARIEPHSGYQLESNHNYGSQEWLKSPQNDSLTCELGEKKPILSLSTLKSPSSIHFLWDCKFKDSISKSPKHQ